MLNFAIHLWLNPTIKQNETSLTYVHTSTNGSIER